jgi:hypothetical protein
MSFTAVLVSTPDVLHIIDSPSSENEHHEHHHHGEHKGGSAHTSTAAISNAAATPPSLDRGIRTLLSDGSFAGWTLWSIRFPEDNGPLSAELRRGNLSMAVDVDPGLGTILDVDEPTGFGVSMDAHNFVQAIHYGRVGGVTTQFLWVLLGLSPTLLAISGYLMWWNRVLSKKLSPSTR